MGQVMFLPFNPNIGCGCGHHCLLSSGFVNRKKQNIVVHQESFFNALRDFKVCRTFC